MASSKCKGVDKERAVGAEAPPPPTNFKRMLLCEQAVTAEVRPKFVVMEKHEREKKQQLSG